MAIAMVCMSAPSYASLALSSDSSAAIKSATSLWCQSLSHRDLIRCTNRPLFLLLSAIFRAKRAVGASVSFAKVAAHQDGASRASGGNNWADSLAKVATKTKHSHDISGFDFKITFSIDGVIPPGDPSRAIATANAIRCSVAWRNSRSQSTHFGSTVSSLVASVAQLHPHLLSFAVCLFSDSLRLRSKAMGYQLRSNPRRFSFEDFVELECCPLCEDDRDVLPHLLFCSALSSVHDANPTIITFLRTFCDRLSVPGLFGAFSSSSESLARFPLHLRSKSLPMDVFLVWADLWQSRLSSLPDDFSPWPDSDLY